MAGIVTACLVAGLHTVLWQAPSVGATAGTPGNITTFAGNPGAGVATKVPQQPTALALRGTTLYESDAQAFVVRAIDLGTGNESIVAGTGSSASTGDGGQATSAAIGIPEGIALDGAGNLYIATIDRIRKVTPAGIISTVAGGGSGGLGDGGLATSATLIAAGVALDSSSNIFIADTGHERIRRVDHSSGIIATVAGNGIQGFAGDTQLATSAELNSPETLLVDGAGNVWFSDTGNNRIREVSSSIITTVAGNGSNVLPCLTGPATGPSAVDIAGPYGLWMDGGGALYVASTASCIQKLQGGNVTLVAGCLSSNCTSADGQPPLQTRLYAVEQAIGDASGNLYIADTGNMKVRELPAGPNPVLSTIAGTGSQCAHNTSGPAIAAYLCDPEGVATDAAGDLFIADRMANVVEEVAVDGTISTVAGNWTYGFSGDGGPATAAQLWAPMAVAVDASGNLYIADLVNGKIRKVSGGVISTLAQIDDPEALAVDAAGNVLVAQSGDNKVSRVTPAGLVSLVAGTGTSGFSGDGGPATAAQLLSPHGIGVAPTGDIYINDALNERVRKVDGNGVISTVAQAASVSQISSPGGQLAIGSDGQIVVVGAYNPSVLLIGPTGIVRTIAGSTTQGFSGDGGPASGALLSLPTGAAFDSAGDLYVSDTNNHRIRLIQTFGATSAPTSATATPGFDSARVQWTAPANATGLAVLEYTVTPYVGATPKTPSVVSGVPAPTSVVIPGLAPGTQYTFTVTAFNGWKASPASAPTSPITVLAHPALGTITTWAGTPGSGAARTIAEAPYSVALAGDHVYVSDVGNAVVRDINRLTSQETVVAGNGGIGYTGNGGPAINAMISAAGAVAHCGGAIYFADTLNFVIRKIDSNGIISVAAGTGSPGYSGDGGPATSAQIGYVFGLACRSGGGLYISDTSNGAVRILDAGGNLRTWWYGFSLPTGITELGANDVVAVSDAGSDNIVVGLTDTPPAYLLAGTPGQAGYAGDNGPVAQSKLNDPRGLAFNGGSGLFIADRGNNRIRQVIAGSIFTLAGTGAAGFSGDGVSYQVELNQPTDLSMNGNLVVVADSGNFRVREINMAGGDMMTTIAGNGTPSRSGDNGPSLEAQVGNPYAIAVDASGNQYVTDAHDNVIRKIDTNGVITTVAGTGIAGYTGDGFAATSAQLSDPRGVALASNGDMYISDTGNQRIRKVDHTNGNISTFVGNGTAGYFGDMGPGLAAEINFPRAVALDANANLYIADTANNRVRRVDHATGVITTVAGTGMPGFSGDGNPATGALLSGPRGLAFDATGNLYISDSGNNRVREIDLIGTITTFAGTGVAGSGGDGHAARGAQLNFPFGLAFDGVGNLYIADTSNQRIRLVSGSSTHIISTVVGACGSGFSGDWGPAEIAQINFPFGLGVDGSGTIYIADSANNRVRIVYGLATVRSGSPCQSPAGSPGSRPANSSPVAPPNPVRIEQSSGKPVIGTAQFIDTPTLARPADIKRAGATQQPGKSSATSGSTRPAQSSTNGPTTSTGAAAGTSTKQPSQSTRGHRYNASIAGYGSTPAASAPTASPWIYIAGLLVAISIAVVVLLVRRWSSRQTRERPPRSNH